MAIKIVNHNISIKELKAMAEDQFGDFVKAVVDVKQKIMAIGGELHADEEVLLMDKEGSLRDYTWGINIYPSQSEEDYIEFDSMVNLKPALGNHTRNVENVSIQKEIREIVKKLISYED